MKTNQKPPKNLTPEAKRWWRHLLEEYDITDEAGLFILATFLEAFDRMRQAQEIIKGEGAQVKDRFGQWKAHPLTTVERDSRAALMAGLKSLNLDIEPLHHRPGRPAGVK